MNYLRLRGLNPIQNLDFSKIIQDKRVMLFTALSLFLIAIIAVVIGFFMNSSRYTIIPPTAEYVPNEIIVSYKVSSSPHEISETEREKLNDRLEALGVVSQERAYKDVSEGELTRSYVFKLKEGTDLVQVQKELESIDELVSSQPNFVYQTFATPNDPQYGSLWGLPIIGAPAAWDTSTGSKSIVVAVLDTGLDMSHSDLSGVGVSPYNAINGGSSVADNVGHGTHVAGTIGAVGNNAVGVSGVNWNVSIMPIQVCSSGGCPQVAIINGIYRAADNGAKVINMSLGTRAPGVDQCSPAQDTHKAIQHAISKGVTVVVAAGNDTRDASQVSPASCQGVITVSATNSGDGRASFTNYGSMVEIAAPGVGVVSTIPGGSYKALDGTSMASPHVAGAAALLLAVNPSLSPQQVSECLVSNGDSIPESGSIGPRLNISKALSACAGVPGAPTPTATPGSQSPTATPGGGGTIRYYIAGRVYQDNNGNSQFDSSDSALSNETVSLSGSISDTASTLSDGTFLFDNLFEGTFSVSYGGAVVDNISLTSTVTAVNVDFIVTKDPANPTPTVVAGPTSVPSTPTPNAPTPTRSATRAPTPTPPTLYTCEYDPKCSSGKSNIQLCPLICKEKVSSSDGRGGNAPRPPTSTPIASAPTTPTPTSIPGAGNTPTPTPLDSNGDINIGELVNSVSEENIREYMSNLVDDDDVSGSDQTQTRYTGSNGLNTETEYVRSKFSEFGLNSTFQNFTFGGVSTRNVIGRIEGQDPNSVYLITSHIDSTAQRSGSTDPAPGANDNGSGTVAVMETARVLKSIQPQLKHSIEFITFSGEEQGLNGSYHYVSSLSSGKNIKGVINMDMIGNNAGSACVTFMYKNYNGGDIISNKLSEMVSKYSLSLSGTSIAGSNGQSDHKPFWDVGIPAVFVHECTFGGSVYHTINDKTDSINFSQISNTSKAVVSAISELATK